MSAAALVVAVGVGVPLAIQETQRPVSPVTGAFPKVPVESLCSVELRARRER